MDAVTTSLPADAAAESYAEAVDRAEHDKARIALTRDGLPVAFIVPVEDAEWLERLEDAEDARLAAEAMAEWKAEGCPPGIPLEEIAARWDIDLAAEAE